MSVRQDVEVLKQIPLFSEADVAELQLLVFAAEQREFAPKEVLVSQGQREDCAFVIVEGNAEILQKNRSGTEETRSRIGAGALIGETAMLAELPYQVTVRALSQVRAIRLTKTLLFRVAEEFPDFADSIFRSYSRKLDSVLADLSDSKSHLSKTGPSSRS